MSPSGLTADLLAMPVASKPSGVPLLSSSGEDPANGVILAQASPGDGLASSPTTPPPVAEVGSASVRLRRGPSEAGEVVGRHLEALEADERRYVQPPLDAATDSAVRLVVALEPGPAEAALVPGTRSPTAGRTAISFDFDANMATLKRFNNHMLRTSLVASAVSTAVGSLRTLTERMG
jgi:hypothetical protein